MLPAYLRYTSPRITFVKNIADENHLPLYILSGKYGLIKDDKEIPYYDHPLSAEEIESLSEKVTKQINELQITEITLYGKPKETDGWGPYYDVLERSAVQAPVSLTIYTLV